MANKLKIRQRIVMDKAEVDSNGFMTIPARLTRVGVFNYTLPDGSIQRQLRHPDDVFDSESLSSLVGLPFTNNHPKMLLDNKNAKNLTVGFVMDIDKDNKYVNGKVKVIDADTIKDIQSGKLEVSCGYSADTVDEKGSFNGEVYDVRQKNIRYNHVSLVNKGRAGKEVRLLMDSSENTIISDELTEQTPIKEVVMEKIMLGGKEFEVSPELAAAFKAHMEQMQGEMDSKSKDMVPKADFEKVQTESKDMGAKVEQTQAKLDAAQDEIKELKTKMDSAGDTEKFNQAVKTRVGLEKKAAPFVKAEVKLDGLTNVEIMKEALKGKFPSLNLDGKSDIYVESRFDHMIETMSEDDKKKAQIGKLIVDAADPQTDNSVEAAKKRQIEATLAAGRSEKI